MSFNILCRIDGFLLGNFEKGCQWVQKQTGLTNFYWGAMCLFLMAMLFLVVDFSVFPEEIVSHESYLFRLSQTSKAFLLILAILCFILALDYKSDEEMAYSRLSEGLANPKKVCSRSRIIRILEPAILLTWFLFINRGIYDNMLGVLFALYSYLRACDPLPPCRGKIGQWLDRNFDRQEPMSNT